MNPTTFLYRFGTAEFDEARFELRVSELPVEVEPKALEVLAVLLRYAGEVVTKEELLQTVWADRVTVEKVLPNAINKLRRALGESNASLIYTQARIGYRLDGNVIRTALMRTTYSSLELVQGQEVSERKHYILEQQLSRTLDSEVWLATHTKTRKHRVYKYALTENRLHSLKREVTLMRLLQESLQGSTCFVELIDWNFDSAPYFLESEYGGLTLAKWASEQLSACNLQQRIALFLQIATAVEAAHSVGVLHKDLKPENILVEGELNNPHVRVTDFGSGHLMEPDRLAQLGITRMGLTVENDGNNESSSGTPLYMAPEIFSGFAPTVKSDVYALGILFYQILSGRVGLPMAPGWESDIQDEILREDLSLATEGNHERRLASVAIFVMRLKSIDQRRADAVEREKQLREIQITRAELARAKARRPALIGLVATLAAGIVVSIWQQQVAVKARNEARTELTRANALSHFVNEELIGRSNPLVLSKGSDATLKEVLLAARDRVSPNFKKFPDTEAALHANLASFFNTLDLLPEAITEAKLALSLFLSNKKNDVQSTRSIVHAQNNLARILSRAGKYEEAKQFIDTLEKTLEGTKDADALRQLAMAKSTYFIGTGKLVDAARELRTALRYGEALPIRETNLDDSLRTDLIQILPLAGEKELAKTEGNKFIAELNQRPDRKELLIAQVQMSLARAYSDDHAAAEKLLTTAQPVIEKYLGKNHTSYLQLLGEKLSFAFRRGDWLTAITLAQQLHEGVKSKFGDNHIMTSVTLTNWARTYLERDDFSNAAKYSRQSYEKLLQIAGPDSPHTHDAAFVYAMAELGLENLISAEKILNKVDAAIMESGRATGQWAIAIDAIRAVILQKQGKHAEARLPLDRGIKEFAPAKGETATEQIYRMALAARKKIK